MFSNLALILRVLLALSVVCIHSQAQLPSPGPVRIRLLDLASGIWPANVTTDFYKLNASNRWEYVATRLTHLTTGAVDTLIHPSNFTSTSYKFVFYSGEYYRKKGLETFYPVLEVAFAKVDDEPHFILVSMSPYGYSSYRGTVN